MVAGYLLVFASAAGFGVLPIFALFAYKSGMSLTTLLFLRFALAAFFFFGCLFVKKIPWRLDKSQFLSLFLLGAVLYSVEAALFFSSVKYIPAPLASLLLYLYPIFVAILSFFFNKERVSLLAAGAIVLSLLGMVFVLGSPSGAVSLTGVLLAAGSAVIYAIYIIIGNRVTSHVSPLLTTSFVTLFAALSFLTAGLFSGSLSFSFQTYGWGAVVGVALFSTILSIFTFFAGMRRTGPTRASILSTIEPVITIIFSALFFQEKMSAAQMIGGAIVLLGAVFVILARDKNKAAPLAAEELIS